MKKRMLAALYLLSLLSGWQPLSLNAQDNTIRVTPNAVATDRFSLVAILPDSVTPKPDPAPWLTAEDQAKASWAYFWMVDDGTFSRKSSLDHTFVTNNPHTASLKVRGRYSDDKEPPHMRVSNAIVPTNAGASTDNLSGTDTLLAQGEQLGVFSNWGAARRGDTIFFALTFRNNTPGAAQSGYLKLRFPSAEFQYLDEVFPSHADLFDNASVLENAEGAGTSTLCTWRVNNVPSGATKTMFVQVLARNAARDSISYIFDADLQWDQELPKTTKGGLISTIGSNNPDVNGAAPNALWFTSEKDTRIVINQARDPNGLTVAPAEIPPAKSSGPTPLIFRVDVENTGNWSTPNLEASVTLDKRINPAAATSSFQSFFPNSPNPAVTPFVEGQKVKFILNNINLEPSLAGNNPKGKGYFTFQTNIASGTELKVGDEIASRAFILMRNANDSLEDSVSTGPAIVRVRNPRRLCFGTLVGLKVYSQLPNTDSVLNRGVCLTASIPLIRPLNNLSSRYLKQVPCLFWQFELGIGTGRFNSPDGFAPIETSLIHLTPALLRATLFRVKYIPVGISAGYSLDYIYKIKAGGSSIPLPDGFGKRLEHEFAASVDLFNIATVPGLSLGAGWKLRLNNLTDQQVTYNFPFAYVQFNFLHLQRRQVQFLNRITRW